MDKYLNAVILESTVKSVQSHYLNQCKTSCTKNNFYFGYGEVYFQKCSALCTRRHSEFENLLAKVKEDLEGKIYKCQESIEGDELNQDRLKSCIFAHQKQALDLLYEKIDKMQNSLA